MMTFYTIDEVTPPTVLPGPCEAVSSGTWTLAECTGVSLHKFKAGRRTAWRWNYQVSFKSDQHSRPVGVIRFDGDVRGAK